MHGIQQAARNVDHRSNGLKSFFSIGLIGAGNPYAVRGGARIRGMRPRNKPRGIVTAFALAVITLALGFALLRWIDPAGDDVATNGDSVGADVSAVVPREGDGGSPAAESESERAAAAAAIQSSGSESTLPVMGVDRNTEYVVEDGIIVPQRLVGPGMASGGTGGEPAVPEASPMDVPTAGGEQLTVPSGVAGPVVDLPDQQVPGGQDAVTRTGSAAASPLQVPGH